MKEKNTAQVIDWYFLLWEAALLLHLSFPFLLFFSTLSMIRRVFSNWFSYNRLPHPAFQWLKPISIALVDWGLPFIKHQLSVKDVGGVPIDVESTGFDCNFFKEWTWMELDEKNLGRRGVWGGWGCFYGVKLSFGDNPWRIFISYV